PLQDARRLDYATDVHRIWIAIKQSKPGRLPPDDPLFVSGKQKKG
ncbi:lytic transglycosylase, partial [Salmonella enterica]|nr:lytic transglycosylase [Salmonella enterica]